MSANRAALSAVWSWKVWSTTKPRRATAAAGASELASERVPQRRSAVSQVAGVPGTPTDRPLVTALVEGEAAGRCR